MSFQASALTTYGKSTLPSVESWGANMNITRDPPKSIHTKRIEKVGDTSKITVMIGDSQDRICESLNVYPRGVNPMVGVSYQTYGSDGGNAKLPYRIMKDGVFRPPVQTLEEQLPLSRQRRPTTNMNTNPAKVDFTKKIRTCTTDKNTKEIKEAILKASVRPTAVYKRSNYQGPTHDVNKHIKDISQININYGLKSMDIKPKLNMENFPGTIDDKINTPAYSNLNSNKHNNEISNIDINTEKYIQDPLNHEGYSNPNSNKHNNEIISDIVIDNHIQDVNPITYTTPATLNKQTEYLSTNIDLQNKTPRHEAYSNKGYSILNKPMQPENDIKTTHNKPTANAMTNKIDIKSTEFLTTKPNLKYTRPTTDMGPRAQNIPKLNSNSVVKLNKSLGR